MSTKTATYYNWNRAAMLSQAGVRADEFSTVDDELSMRIDMQNMYACVKEEDVPKAIEIIQHTLTPAITKAVDQFMRNKKKIRSCRR